MPSGRHRLIPLSVLVSGSLLAFGCRSDSQADAAKESAKAPVPPARSDSLALSAGGVQVWYTLERAATADDGGRCIERALEIRRDGTRVKVPLLYTGAPPVLVDDTTMRAVLWTGCIPVDAYLVDLRSGQPIRDTSRSNQPKRERS